MSKDGTNSVFILTRKIGGFYKLLNFTDEIGKDRKDLNTFKRMYKNVTLFFKKGEQTTLLEEIKSSYIKKINPQPTPNYKIITMDLETKEINNKMEPVCVSIYIGGDQDPIIKSFAI
jgi:hypothetical protein